MISETPFGSYFMCDFVPQNAIEVETDLVSLQSAKCIMCCFISSIIGFILALTAGIIAFIIITMLYFIRTNKSAERMASNQNIAKSFFQRTRSFIQLTTVDRTPPSYYLYKLFGVRHTRNVNHYNQEILDKVFKQNHFNAKFFELAIIISFIILGVFQNYSIIVIPAGASILLVFTLFLMFVSFLYSWFKGWTLMIIIFTILSLNFVSLNTQFIKTKNFAYGLNYKNTVNYDLSTLKTTQFNKNVLSNDIDHHIKILENWKEKATVIQGTDKPKLLLLNVSGGGIRSAMWTFSVLQNLDKATNGNFIKNTNNSIRFINLIIVFNQYHINRLCPNLSKFYLT